MLACAVVTVLLALLAATQLALSASFDKMIPRSHPYIQNYLDNRVELRGLGNALRIVVENPNGDIYDPKYQATLQQDPRRGLPHAGRRPRLGQVAVGAGRALDRGDRRGLPRRPGDARQLRRLRQAPPSSCAPTSRAPASSAAWSATTSSRACWWCRCSTPTRRTGKRIDYRALSHAIEQDPRPGRGRRRRAHARDRLRQAGRRPDRRPDAGGAVLRPGRADRRRDHLALHALRALDRAGDGLLAGGRGLAARAGGGARLRARPVFDPGALPGLRHRRQPRRAEDERHHAGHRARRAPAGGRALHLPPPVPGRADRAAGRRGRLRGADGDRHRRSSRTWR